MQIKWEKIKNLSVGLGSFYNELSDLGEDFFA